MRAAVYYGPNKIEIADVGEPEPAPGTVKVKVGYNGICGTDLHEYYAGPIFVPTEPHPLTGQQMPLVIGHEFSGVITDIGAGVTGWSEGDRVAVEPIYRCGNCPACQAGNYNICAQIGFHGLMSDGGMAEYTVVPTDMLHKLPDNVSLQLGALVEPMSVAYHAATLGEVRSGDTAMVFGAGPIGIGLWFALRGKGLEDTFVVALVGPVVDVTPDEVAKIWAVNVDGVLWGTQAAVAKFSELGNKDSGKISRIINASSIAGHDGFAMLGVYSATKFAVRALTQAAAKEHAADGITVNAYCPGVVGTDMWVEIDKRFAELTGAAEGETYDKFVGGIALGRGETPDDLAGFVSYLAGDDAEYMTGQSGLIDGGLVYR